MFRVFVLFTQSWLGYYCCVFLPLQVFEEQENEKSRKFGDGDGAQSNITVPIIVNFLGQ
jgi:hypothetical protein